MPNTPMPRSRKLAAVLLIVVITALAGLAIDRTVEASIIDSVSARLAAVGTIFTVKATEPEKTGNSAAKPEGLGIGGKSVIFGQYSSGTPIFTDGTRVDKLKIFDPVSQSLTPLGSINDFDPVLSPDGTQIAFLSYRDAPYRSTDLERESRRRLYIMNADGSGQTRVDPGNFGGAQYQPSFSPPSVSPQYLLFVGDGQESGIYRTDMLGGTELLMSDNIFDTNCPHENTGRKNRRKKANLNGDGYVTNYSRPSYSPDGSKIVFGKYDDYDADGSDPEGWDIYEMDPTVGGQCRQLYNDLNYSGLDPEPVYSPDGSKIAFIYGNDAGTGGHQATLVILDRFSTSYSELTPTDLWGTPVWTANDKVAYIAQFNQGGGQVNPSRDIKAVDINTHQVENIYTGTLTNELRGMDIGFPSTVVPNVSLRITGDNPVMGGYSTTATLKLATAAPAGGITFNVGVFDLPVGQVTIPQSTVTVPEGATEVTIPVNTLIRPDDGRTAGIYAQTFTPSYMYAEATLSLQKTKPDLQAVTFNAPTAIGPDAQFTVDWSVTNIGLVDTGINGGTDQVFFSVDNVLDTGDTELASASNPALAAGATRTNTATSQFGIPGGVIPGPGDYFLILMADRPDDVDEGGRSANNTIVRPIHIDLPDLVPENFVAPATIEPGVDYTLSWTLRNAGTVPATHYTTTVVYFSFNTVVGDADDLQLDFVTANGPIAAGASLAQSKSINIATVPARGDGQGIFYVKIDYNNDVNEGSTGEANNIVQALSMFQYRVPDLQVTAGSAPAGIVTDTAFPLTWTTSNTGNKDVPNLTDDVYFSQDNQVGGADDHFLGSFPLAGGLAHGTSIERIQNVTIDTDWITATGNYYVYVKTDSTNLSDEGVNENNNIRFQPVSVQRLQRPDLTVTNIVAPTTALFGEMITIQWTVTNSGQGGPTNAPAWKDRINLNTTGDNYSYSGQIAEVDNATALDPGQSYTASVTVRIPNGYVGSDYKIVVTPDSRGDLNEEDVTNNKTLRAIDIDAPPLPDIQFTGPTSVQAQDTGYAGLPFEVHWTGTNTGNAVAQDDEKVRENKTWATTDAIYLSRDTTLDSSDIRILLTYGFYSPLAANASYTRDSWTGVTSDNPGNWVKLPYGVEGQYYVFVASDIYNVVYEYTGDSNNFGYDPTPVNIINTPADLTITDPMIAPSTGTSGNAYDMTFTVKNQGANPTWAVWYDAIYLSDDATWSADDLQLFLKANSGLSGGGTRAVTGRVTIPFCFEGTKYLIPKTDTTNRQPEFDPNLDAEANNAGPAFPISLTSLPMDLVAANVTTNPDPPASAGSTITVSWTESNIGTGQTQSYWYDRISLVRQDNTVVTTLAEPRFDTPLAAGASVVRSFNVNLPPFMQDTYKIRVEENSGTNRSECSPGNTNNTADSAPFTLANNLPDLTTQNITTDLPTYSAGAPVTITYDEVNLGLTPAVGENGWTTYAYLSTDTTLSNGDTFAGYVNSTTPLAPGASRQLVINGVIGNVTAGLYNVLLFTDASYKVYEGPGGTPYELNNVQSSGLINVTLPAIDLTPSINSVTTPTYSGQGISVNYTVSNTGTQQTQASSWYDFVYLSRDSVLDTTDPRIGYTLHQGALAGGATYTHTITALLPTGLTGTYYVFLKTDVGRSVVEASTANNVTAPLSVNLQLPPPSDLSITNITQTAAIAPGSAITISFTTQNSSSNVAYGKWRTSFYLSTDQVWDANDYLLGQKERDGLPFAAGATETVSTGFGVPMIPEGTYYVIARVDSRNAIPESDESNNVTVSGTFSTAAIETLTMGTASNLSFTGGGERLFKFLPPLNETVLVTLDGQPGSWNRLLTGKDTPPSLAHYDFRDDGARSEDKENSIPNTDTNSYYSLVKTDFIPAEQSLALQKQAKDVANATIPGTQNLSVKAEVIGFGVRTVSPSTVGNIGVATLKITGAKFAQGATVELLQQGGSVVIPAHLQAVTSTDIRALFDLTGKPAGVYDLRVTNPAPDNRVSVKTNALTVVNGGGHQLRMDFAGPAAIYKLVTKTRFTVSLINDGLNDAQAVPITLEIPEEATYTIDQGNFVDYPEALLPDGMTDADVPLHLVQNGRKTIHLLAPLVQAHSQIDVSFNLVMPAGAAFDVKYGMGIPWADLIAPGDGVFGSTSRIQFKDGKLSKTTADYVEFAKCMAEFLRALAFFIASEIGEASCVAAGKALIGAVVDYVSGLALTKAAGQASETSIVTSGVGMWLSVAKNAALCAGTNFPAFKAASLIFGIANLLKQAIDCLKYLWDWGVGVFEAYDPNEKIGPLGYGPEKWVGIKQPLQYRIDFENLSSATAPAQKIYVEDQLPPGLDPRTLRLKEIAFHHYSYQMPDNTVIFQSREQLGSDLNDLKVNISAGLDIVNRRVTWTLTGVDPQTGERPIDPRIGILPPNNANHDGEGYVIFTVEADAASPTGTNIANKASIIFDENPAIETNVTANLIDSVVPTSALTLDASTDGNTPVINYSWTGTDDANGSLVESCSIMASENNASYLPNGLFPSLAGTGTFTGRWGKTYSLYTICKDNAGNVEMPPIAPDATIQIRGGDTESDVAPRPEGSNGVVDGGDVAEIRNFAAGLGGTMQYNEFQRADSAPKANGGNGSITVADIMQARRFAGGLDTRAEAAGPNAVVPFAPNFFDGKRANLLDPRGLSIVRAYRGMNKLRVAIQLSAQGDESGTGFSLNFDPAVLSNPVVTAGDDASGAAVTTNLTQAAAGQIGVILDRAPADVWASGYRFLVLVEFDVIGAPPANTTMSFGDTPVKMETVDGLAATLTATYSPATIELLSPTAATVSVGGRVIDASGRPVRNATLQLMQANGGRVRVLSNAFGYFRFDNVVSGSTYVIATTARGLQFAPRVINVSDGITDLEIQAAP